MRRRAYGLLAAVGGASAVPGTAWAAGAEPVNTGDTAWVLVASALVLLMTPGLALFYGGMVRSKNVVATILQTFIIIALVSLQWVACGYSLAFGPDWHHLIGGLDWAGFAHVGFAPAAEYAPTIPHEVFAVFQMMFAIITPALIIGATAERIKFSALVVFLLLWATLVYDPLAHWVWGQGGWLRQLGVLDFAGGTVVHISSGVAGLVAALALGPRRGYGRDASLHRPHNVPMTMIGASLLWFGWFGFNAGSALGANAVAGNAFLTTNTAAAAAALAWVLAEWAGSGHPTLTGASAGGVVGLVAITPAAGYVTPLAALAIGAVGGLIGWWAVAVLKPRLGYDDALDTFGCHGVGGTWGALATGLLATAAVNAAGGDGLLYGNPHQLLVQLLSVAVA
jgi:Amt family ammonium transporter